MSAKPKVAASLPRRTSSAFFHWQVAGEPIAVHFLLNTVELLERDAIRGGKATAAGILVGRREGGIHLTFIVEGYEPIPVTSWNDSVPFGNRERMESIVERWLPKTGRRMEILGFYRTSTTGETGLSKDDLAVLEWNPTQSNEIFLLIEPHADRASEGLLFMAEGGLVTWKWNVEAFNRAAMSRNGAASAPLAKRPSFDLENMNEEDQDSNRSSNRPESKPWKYGQWLIVAATVIVLAAIFFQFRGKEMLSYLSTNSEPSNDAHLGLKLERTGADWSLSWNPDAPTLAKATKGQLFITDGVLHKNVDLDVSDLRGGKIMYSPVTNDVVFQLQVDSADATQPVSESVRILGGLASSLPSSPVQNMSSSWSDPRLLEHQSRPSPDVRKTEDTGKKPSSPSLPAESASNGTQEAQKNKSPEIPASVPQIENRTKPAAENAAVVPASTSVAPPPPAPKPQPEATPGLVTRTSEKPTEIDMPKPIQQGGIAEAAQLLVHMDPVYPLIAKQREISGSVEVHYKIDATGQVRDITVANGPILLRQAAVEAVRNRRYKPARIDGVPTATDASAVFVFTLN